jgi:putative transposase
VFKQLDCGLPKTRQTSYHSVLHPVSMANQQAFKSNNNLVDSCQCDVAWTPKLLFRGVDVRLKETVSEIADELPCEVLERERLPDDAHRRCEVDPSFGIHRFDKRVKGRRSRWLRQEFD